MTIPKSLSYKGFGDTTLAVYRTEFARVNSPMLADVEATYKAAQPYSALFLGQAWFENQYETTGHIIKPSDHNPVSLRPWNEDPRGTPPGAVGIITDGGPFLKFATDADCVREWKRRLFDDPAYKGGVYRKAGTLEEMLNIYCPPGDVHPVTGVDNADIDYAGAVRTMIAKYAALEGTSTTTPPQEDTTVSDTVGKIIDIVKNVTTPKALVFGKVPMPGYVDRQAATANKPEGIGWDNLGRRPPMFIVLHRMCGTLNSTDSFFPQASTQALTDFGIGTANVDGAASDGKIIQWNDPRGYRAGWSSGPVSAPYGDALRWIQWSGNRWGVSICNVCGVSIEHSGQYSDSMTDFAFSEDAKLVAYWLDQIGVHWDKAPLHPVTGISAITYHVEWTIGTGKICPGPWLESQIDRLIAAAAAIMKQYQTQEISGGVVTPTPPVVNVPKPTYDTPVPIPELAAFGKGDNDTAQATVTREGMRFFYVGDRVRAVKDTPRLRYADPKGGNVGPDIKKGDACDVMFRFTAKDGTDYFYSPFHTRLIADDFERIGDTPSYASNS